MKRKLRLLRQVIKFYSVYHSSESKHKKELLDFVDEIEEQLSLNVVGCSLPTKEEITNELKITEKNWGVANDSENEKQAFRLGFRSCVSYMKNHLM